MKMTISLFTIALLSIITMPAFAKHKGHDFDRLERFESVEQRLDNQRYRIRQGIKNGSLTKKETKHLRLQQKHIIRLAHRFMQDGYLDRREIRELRNKLEQASDRIYRFKHNDRSRDKNYRLTRYYY